MQKFTKLFPLLVGFLLFSFFSEKAVSQENVKRVLVEAHTSAQDIWTPGELAEIDRLKQLFGDRVIPISLHFNDAMATSVQGEIMQTFNMSRPNLGTLDRRYITVSSSTADSTRIPWHIAVWHGVVAQLLQEPPIVALNLRWHFNPANNEIIANIDAKFSQNVNGDFRFNLIILEDDVVGVGPGFDQENLYSNHSGHKDHPYYSKPRVIRGFKHQNVLRAMLGGAFGAPGTIPTSVQAGQTYSWRFTHSLHSSWNINNIRLVGIVQILGQHHSGTGNTFDVLNSIEGVRQLPSTDITTVGPVYGVRSQEQPFVKIFNIRNRSGVPRTYEFTAQKSSRTPFNWSAEIELPNKVEKVDNTQSVELTIQPGQTVEVGVKLTPTYMIGIGDALLVVQEKNNPDALPNASQITVLSGEVNSLEIIDDNAGGIHSLRSSVQFTGREQYIPIELSTFQLVRSQLENLKTVIWTTGAAGSINAQSADVLNTLINSGVGAIISGGVCFSSLAAETNNNHPLFSSIGVKWRKEIPDIEQFYFVGVEKDSITDQFWSSTLFLVGGSYWLQALQITNPELATAILFRSHTDDIMATRSELASGARVVVLSFNPYVITSLEERTMLIGRALNYIEKRSSGVGAIFTSDRSDLSFGVLDTGKTKTLTFNIINAGSDPLMINNMEIAWNEYAGFSLPPEQEINFIVEPGATKPVAVTFHPKEVMSYSAALDIITNALNGAQHTVFIDGFGASGHSPSIATNIAQNTLNFGSVKHPNIGYNDFTISNIGVDDLQIFNIDLQQEKEVFFFVSGANYPVTVKKGLPRVINMRFEPLLTYEDVEYTGRIVIQSNADNFSTLYINLVGKGDKTLSVDYETESYDGLIALKAAPNPITDFSKISYKYNGEKPENIRIFVIDALGRNLVNLKQGLVSQGEFFIDFNAEQFSQGVYYIIAEIAGQSVKLPISIVK